MGAQEDPELDVWLGRGMVRVYDGERTPMEGRPVAPPTGRRGATYLPGGPAEGPQEAHHVRLWGAA